ncbi:hypothetical protein SAMN04487970_101578 [Paenibacillus tianmuensis]|uniref:Uncharacterized protein n=1 Tax=Paenibacillus tianmuensis TaxID=624147 RepID=A0A1G4RGE3_9BACL|nr:hypothetical protein [Paenibacillus tianmuensis]SCW56032.1 hypothetical protein SAMN04487970_101578 [Paenibacillus tianmuensis]
MTVPVICIAIAVILVIVLIMYNMRSTTSAPVPRSERQFPGHSEEAPEQGPQAEEPAADQERVKARTVQRTSAAEQGAEVRAAHKPIAQSGRVLAPEADAEAARTSAKLADPEYRQALRGFTQPARSETLSEKAGEAPMKDNDFRTALRSMHNKKQ